jgi:predicted  nucleic acid-binding Zn-ribbon protein
MKRIDLVSTEEQYYERLDADEQQIYLADKNTLDKLNASEHEIVKDFANISKLNEELHRLHQRYNDVTEQLMSLGNDTAEKQAKFDQQYLLLEESFTVTIKIGDAASVHYLGCMDNCDSLYKFLSEVKMNTFNHMSDYVPVSELLEPIKSIL